MSGRFRTLGLALGGVGFGLAVYVVAAGLAAHALGPALGGLGDRTSEVRVVYPNL